VLDHLGITGSPVVEPSTGRALRSSWRNDKLCNCLPVDTSAQKYRRQQFANHLS
jgi:hypothetical protein